MSSKRPTIYTGITLGVAFASTISYVFKQKMSHKFSDVDMSDSERLMFVFRCLAFSALPLFGAMYNVARFRGEHIDTIGADPFAPVPAAALKSFRVAERVLQNTMEQSALHVFTVLALASCISVDQLYMIPCLVLIFNLGRFAFAVGYHYRPWYRGFGFILNLIPTLAGLFYALYIIASRALFD